MELTIMIICAVLAIMLVNFLYRLLLTITGGSAMFYSIKGKIFLYVIAFIVLYGMIGGMLGVVD